MEPRLDHGGRRIVVVLALALGGCSEGSTDDPIEPRFSSLDEEIWSLSCDLGSCHSTMMQAGELNLEAGAYEQLVGPAAVQPAAVAEGLARVVPGDPDSSFLWIKLQPDLDARYGVLMPQGSVDGLDDDKLMAIREWIVAGAAND